MNTCDQLNYDLVISLDLNVLNFGWDGKNYMIILYNGNYLDIWYEVNDSYDCILQFYLLLFKID